MFLEVPFSQKIEHELNMTLHDFLPAALEVQETPPARFARWIIWLIILFIVIAIIWASLGKVDVVATAEGRIIPSSRTKNIQPLEIATVKTILVEEGDIVQTGQDLILLDAGALQSELQNLRQQYQAEQALIERLSTLVQWIDHPEKTRSHSIEPLNTDVLLAQQWQDFQTEQQRLLQLINTRKAELDTSLGQANKLQQGLNILNERLKPFKALSDQRVVSRMEYLTVLQQYTELKQEIEVEGLRQHSLQSQIAEAHEQQHNHQARILSQTLERLQETQKKSDSLKEESIKIEDQIKKYTLTAPVTGVIQNLAVFSAGSVVTPAQIIANIVPEEDHLKVEAWLLNKDIGFVHVGQTAEIKIQTFPFARYGIVPATITKMGADAVIDEKQGAIYSMHLTLEKNTLSVNGKAVPLSAGMSVTAEIKTGKRRVISFFLEPLMRRAQESIGER